MSISTERSKALIFGSESLAEAIAACDSPHLHHFMKQLELSVRSAPQPTLKSLLQTADDLTRSFSSGDKDGYQPSEQVRFRASEIFEYESDLRERLKAGAKDDSIDDIILMRGYLVCDAIKEAADQGKVKGVKQDPIWIWRHHVEKSGLNDVQIRTVMPYIMGAYVNSGGWSAAKKGAVELSKSGLKDCVQKRERFLMQLTRDQQESDD